MWRRWDRWERSPPPLHLELQKTQQWNMESNNLSLRWCVLSLFYCYDFYHLFDSQNEKIISNHPCEINYGLGMMHLETREELGRDVEWVIHRTATLNHSLNFSRYQLLIDCSSEGADSDNWSRRNWCTHTVQNRECRMCIFTMIIWKKNGS